MDNKTHITAGSSTGENLVGQFVMHPAHLRLFQRMQTLGGHRTLTGDLLAIRSSSGIDISTALPNSEPFRGAQMDSPLCNHLKET